MNGPIAALGSLAGGVIDDLAAARLDEADRRMEAAGERVRRAARDGSRRRAEQVAETLAVLEERIALLDLCDAPEVQSLRRQLAVQRARVARSEGTP